ncbi:hypothetical protein Q3G72_018009 [Acer saccharum]|nr:hypothetical protein Q3G72_018009 [Acer saccharum]
MQEWRRRENRWRRTSTRIHRQSGANRRRSRWHMKEADNDLGGSGDGGGIGEGGGMERGLLKRVGICHGISGNSYFFLALYRLTSKVDYLYRAKAFSCFLLDRAQKLISEGKMHGGDRPYSIFEGIGGMACLFLDMIEPSEAKFPAYDHGRCLLNT